MTRRNVLMMGGAAIAALGLGIIFHTNPRLIWNASASVPVGLYRLESAPHLVRGDLVAAHTPDRFAPLFAARHYLPSGVPLLKYVAALPGQRVCRHNENITLDGKRVATARHFDRKGRALPAWQGCIRLTSEQVFLLNAAVRDSLDGRYFGVVPRQSILGHAVPFWTPSTHSLVPNVHQSRAPPLAIQPPNHRQGETQ